jgi:hypothetical protein
MNNNTFKGTVDCNKNGEQSQETCRPVRTERHTIFTNGHVPFLFALLSLTTASFFPLIVPFKTQRKLALCS